MIEQMYIEKLGDSINLHDLGGVLLGKTVILMPGDSYGKIRYDQFAPLSNTEIEVDAEAGAIRKRG